MSINSVILWVSLAVAAAVSFAENKPMKPRMAISPPKIDVELDEKGASESITVLNVSDSDLEVQVTVSNWALDENNKIKILPPEAHSLDQWIIINPLRFTIPKGESQTVRFAIRPRTRPREGEYKAMIYLTEILPQAPSEQPGFRVSFKFGAPVYAHVGEKILAGRLLDSAVASYGAGQMQAKFRVVNDGNAKIRLSGNYAIWRRDHYPGDQLASAWITSTSIENNKENRDEDEDTGIAKPVLAGPVRLPPVFPGNDRWVTMLLQKPEPGVYHMLVSGEVAGKPVLQALEFTL